MCRPGGGREQDHVLEQEGIYQLTSGIELRSGASRDHGAWWWDNEPFTACAGCHLSVLRGGREQKVGNGHAGEDIVNSLRRRTRFSQQY